MQKGPQNPDEDAAADECGCFAPFGGMTRIRFKGSPGLMTQVSAGRRRPRDKDFNPHPSDPSPRCQSNEQGFALSSSQLSS
jgi:hypothetical protein